MGLGLAQPDKWLFAAIFAGLTWLASGHVFFWDTVQFAGKHGLWFYENGFSRWLLPPEIDSGHPPAFGWYLALVWMVFGKSLAVSHWAMFPFLLGIIWQLFRLSGYYLQRTPAYWLPLIVLADPVFLGQSILVSPDIPLAFFFLWALNSLLHGRRPAYALACLGLALISLRGMMVVAALGVFDLWSRRTSLRPDNGWPRISWMAAYLPAAGFSLAFLLTHYLRYQWIGYHGASPWAPSFEQVGPLGLLRNLAVLAWRWLDHGRVFVWLVVACLLWAHRSTITNHRIPCLLGRGLAGPPTAAARQAGFFLILTAALSISFLLYRGLHAHRYLLPAFLVFSILSVILADMVASARLRRTLLIVLLGGLLSGNLWIYPDRIAQGWDATLAHWPYYSLRRQMLEYIDEAGILPEQVGTAFPEIGPLKYRDLSGRTGGFREKDLVSDRWVLYSNIMNDFTDAELMALQQHWQEQQRFQARGIKMILYRRPAAQPLQ